VLHRHRQRLEAARLELAVRGHDLRHLVHADGAGGGPEVHQQHLAAQGLVRPALPSSSV
jgi:hypothetical protein